MTETGSRYTPVRWLVGSILLLAAIDTAAWALACQRLQTGVDDAVAQAKLAGWTVSGTRTHWSGWPVRAALEFASVAAEARPTVFPSGLRWTAEHVALVLSPLHPTRLLVLPSGAETIAAEGIPPTRFDSTTLRLTLDLTANDPPHLAATGLAMTLPQGLFRIQTADLLLPPDGLMADIAGVAIPDARAPAIDRITLALTLAPPFPTAPTPAASARSWRAANGHVDITSATLRWAALDATAQASVQLDADLQPAASGTIHASGLPATLDDLAQARLVPRSSALAAKAVLALLAAPDGGNAVTLPLALEHGILTLGRFPLLRLPALLWQ